MARSSLSCSLMRIIPTSLLKSNLSRKWYGFLSPCVGVWTRTDGASFIQMCMLRGTCVLIFCRIGGRLPMTLPLSSHRTSSFPSHFLLLLLAPCHASCRPPPSLYPHYPVYVRICFRLFQVLILCCLSVSLGSGTELSSSIQSLLNDPNNASPANVEAATLHRENVREYVKRVRETVEQSWECDDE